LIATLAFWCYEEPEVEKYNEFARQAREAEEHNRTLSDSVRHPQYEMHPQTSYCSKPINTKETIESLQQNDNEQYLNLDIDDFDLDELSLHEDLQEQSSTQAQIQISPK